MGTRAKTFVTYLLTVECIFQLLTLILYHTRMFI